MNIIVDNNNAYSDVQFFSNIVISNEDKVREFVNLICSNSLKDYDKLIYILESEDFYEIVESLTNNYYDINITYSKINFDIIELLRGFNKLDVFTKNYNKLNVIDILCNLFLENNKDITKYIEYFWKWAETYPHSLIDYRFNNASIANIIVLHCKDKVIREEYFHKFVDLWDQYYPELELPSINSLNELVDGENIYYLLAQKFMNKELIRLFSRKSYDANLYEWRKYDYNAIYDSIAVPIISYMLQEFSYLRKEKDLHKLANTLDILITYGKINFDQKVIDLDYTLSDYLNHYGYLYDSSPVIHMLLTHADICAQSGKHIYNFYEYNNNKPYDMIWKKYEYTKDPELINQIISDIKKEFIKTGIDSNKFLIDSGLCELIGSID